MHVDCWHLFLASKVGYHMENCVIIMLTMVSKYMDIGSDEKQSSSGNLVKQDTEDVSGITWMSYCFHSFIMVLGFCIIFYFTV